MLCSSFLAEPCPIKIKQKTCEGTKDNICNINGKVLEILNVSPQNKKCGQGLDYDYGLSEDKNSVWVDNGCNARFTLKVCDGMYIDILIIN